MPAPSTTRFSPPRSIRRALALTAGTIALGTLFSCGGSGGAQVGPPPPPPPPPPPFASANIVFPPSGALADNEQILVQGTATADEGVAAVRVNGVTASAGVEPGEWQALIPLNDADNPIRVEVEDRTGRKQSDAASITIRKTGGLLALPSAVALDPTDNTVLILDGQIGSLLRLDPNNGSRRTLSSESVGSGTSLRGAFALGLDIGQDRAIALSTVAVLAIDLITGNRTVISSSSRGGGSAFRRFGGMAVDASAQIAFVTDSSSNQILQVDLATGRRSLVSSSRRGGGVALRFPSTIAYDAAGSRLLVYNNGPVLSVHSSSGARTLLAGDTRGIGPTTIGINGLVIGAARNFAYAATRNAVLRIRLDNGDRSIVSDKDTGTGPEFRYLTCIASDPAKTRLLVGDNESDSIQAVDLAFGSAGNRTELTRAAAGSGDAFVDPRDVAFDAAGNRWLFTDRNLAALYAIDRKTGRRSVVSSDARGTGPTLTGISGVAMDAARKRALVTNRSEKSVLAVDLETGNRTEVTGPNVGSGPELTRPDYIEVDATQKFAYVMDYGTLQRVDLTSGDRVTISSRSVGSGPTVPAGRGLTLDNARGLAYVPDENGRIYRISLTRGIRSLVTDRTIGSGPSPSSMRAAAYDPRTDRILVANRGGAELIEVDPTSGTRTLMAAPSSAPANPLVNCFAMDLSPDGRQLFAVDNGFNAVMVIDRTRRDRVVLAK